MYGHEDPGGCTPVTSTMVLNNGQIYGGQDKDATSETQKDGKLKPFRGMNKRQQQQGGCGQGGQKNGTAADPVTDCTPKEGA